MKQLFFLLYIATTLMACHGITGSGNIITEKRDPGTFHGIVTSGSIDVEVMNGSAYMVDVEADDNVLKYVITDIKGGNLDIRFKSHMSFINVHAKVIVTAPGFDHLSVSGSGSIISRSDIIQDRKLIVNVSGSGDIKLGLEAPAVQADITGSGSIAINGRTKNFDASITGSGDLKCSELKSENTNVEITGSGSARVFASVSLKARTIGSGDIYYSGHPGNTEIKKGGSGSIKAE